MDRGHKPLSFLHFSTSALLMIVHNFYVIAVAMAPDKADAPLIIDSDRMLAVAVSSQRLQSIPRRRSQDSQFCRGVQLKQFAQRDAFDGAETLAVLVVKKLLGLLRAKALNHTPSVLRGTLHVKHPARGPADNLSTSVV